MSDIYPAECERYEEMSLCSSSVFVPVQALAVAREENFIQFKSTDK